MSNDFEALFFGKKKDIKKDRSPSFLEICHPQGPPGCEKGRFLKNGFFRLFSSRGFFGSKYMKVPTRTPPTPKTHFLKKALLFQNSVFSGVVFSKMTFLVHIGFSQKKGVLSQSRRHFLDFCSKTLQKAPKSPISGFSPAGFWRQKTHCAVARRALSYRIFGHAAEINRVPMRQGTSESRKTVRWKKTRKRPQKSAQKTRFFAQSAKSGLPGTVRSQNLAEKPKKGPFWRHPKWPKSIFAIF